MLPGLRDIRGYAGGFVLRRDVGDEVEFAVLNLFESLESVREFAGEDYEVPVFEPRLGCCSRELSRSPGTTKCGRLGILFTMRDMSVHRTGEPMIDWIGWALSGLALVVDLVNRMWARQAASLPLEVTRVGTK